MTHENSIQPPGKLRQFRKELQEAPSRSAEKRLYRLSRRFFFSLLLSASALSACGCVYYNTYFNARKAYNEAEKTRKDDPERDLTSTEKRLYDRTINKCAKIILDYPSSEWRDDAVLLMGKAFYRKGDYDKAQVKFMELRTLYKESELQDEAKYFESMTLLAKGEYNRSRRLLGELELSGWPEPALPLLYADCLYRTGETDSALVRYKKLSKAAENQDIQAQSILSCVEILISTDRRKEALEFIRSTPAPARSGSDTRFRLKFAEAECLHASGEPEEALSVLKELADREEFFDFNDKTLLKMAFLEADSILIQTAVEQRGLTGEAAAEYELSRLERAASLYNDVANRYPRTDSGCEAYFSLGVIHRDRLGDLDAAKDAFRSSSREKPSSDTGKAAFLEHASLIKLNALIEKLDQAEDGEARAGLHMEMAELFLLQIRKPTEAKKHYDAVRKEAPGSTFALKAQLATAWIERYRFDNRAGADSLYTDLAARFPDSEEAKKARLELGWSLEEKSEPADTTVTRGAPAKDRAPAGENGFAAGNGAAAGDKEQN